LHVSSILVAVTNFLEVALVRLSPCPAALLAAVVLLTGCGGDDPGTRVAYTVQAADPAAISGEVAAVLRGRLAAAGVDGASVSAAGDEVVISADGDDDRTRAAIVAMTVPGRLRFYDWEANVLGPGGRPAPADPTVTGGVAAGDGHGGLSRYGAVLRAARAPGHGATRGARAYWLVDDKRRRVLRVATSARAQLLRKTRPTGTRIVVVPAGRLVVRAPAPATDRWYVLDDDPAATGTDIDGARPGHDQIADAPVVLYTFTPHGQTAFSALTARLAHRGARAARAGAHGFDANQHFAIVVDDRIIATPYIDYRQSPDGVDAAVGAQISGGLTAQEAARVAGLISSGPLPAALVARDMKAQP
jgi:SecD/SecF fusion protein